MERCWRKAAALALMVFGVPWLQSIWSQRGGHNWATEHARVHTHPHPHAHTHTEIWASQVVQCLKNLPANSGDTGSIPGWGRSPGEGNGNPFQYSCLGNPMDRALAGSSPWGHNDSDMTEHVHLRSRKNVHRVKRDDWL